MSKWETELRNQAADLLKSGEVAMVLGYGRGTLTGRTRPVFISKPEEAESLVYNESCRNNLATYLPHLTVKGKIAIVARPNDVRTLVTLIQEKQIERDQIHIIAFTQDKENDIPTIYDTLIQADLPANENNDNPYEAFEKKPPEERWKIFESEMAKCIRCYACRNACPMCYCSECFIERSIPRWVGEGSNLSDTMLFHLTRAMHSAGRCGECGACVAACPMGVDLDLINHKLNSDLLKLFGHQAGKSLETPSAMATFDLNDYNDFIK